MQNLDLGKIVTSILKQTVLWTASFVFLGWLGTVDAPEDVRAYMLKALAMAGIALGILLGFMVEYYNQTGRLK